MRTVMAVLLLCFFIPNVINAQDVSTTPKVEFYGGYSFIHTPDLENLSGSTLQGWDVAVTTNFTSWFGVTSDFSGHYFDLSQTTPATGTLPERTLRQNGSAYNFLLGPRFSLRRSRYVVFTHALLGPRYGVEHSTLSSLPNEKFDTSGSLFAAAYGGGLDLALNRRISFRPVQAEYFMMRSHGFTTNHFRYSAGLVFHLGQKK